MNEELLEIRIKLADMNSELSQLGNYLSDLSSPCVMYKPKLSVDGNMYCFLLGDDLQSGVAGFGKSPALAAADFNSNFSERLL